MKNEKFVAFLENLKDEENQNLVETITKGYESLCEASDAMIKAILKKVMTDPAIKDGKYEQKVRLLNLMKDEEGNPIGHLLVMEFNKMFLVPIVEQFMKKHPDASPEMAARYFMMHGKEKGSMFVKQLIGLYSDRVGANAKDMINTI